MSHLNSSKLNLQSSLTSLNKGRSTKSIEKLIASGIQTIEDLFWIIPLSIKSLPKLNSFKFAQASHLFLGRGEALHTENKPGKSFGKGKIPLKNISLTIRDLYSSEIMTLKWFNAYPSLAKKIGLLKRLEFKGPVSLFQNKLQIINPEVEEIGPDCHTRKEPGENKFKVTYPTINGVTSKSISSLISKIPEKLWNEVPDSLQESIHQKRDLISLNKAFIILHGNSEDKRDQVSLSSAKRRLIYEEFLREQLKISLRKNKEKKKAFSLEILDADFNEVLTSFPYKLTPDQVIVAKEIREDMKSGTPMMRLVQGDVGCGKTSIAIISAMIALKNNYQVALMCPTESLALQHFIDLKSYFKSSQFKVRLLTGGLKKKEKEQLRQDLANGDIDFIIGTHSLIQKDIVFKKLSLSIIDEQHKFGVNQRLTLSKKDTQAHTLIMTATPIPRSLSLTHYGDLSISIIKSMPQGRKGTQTRIINQENFHLFLNFIKTRLSMNEQVYIVVPAIIENPESDLTNLEQALNKFKTIFPQYKIKGMHGQLKGDEKQLIFEEFSTHKFDILIATSLIEVGINILNATVMAIMNPERFGLSSLHQLRGRVGRGEKPGFCFLVNSKKISRESMTRLLILKENTDGFIIAEEDLKIRGEGNLFGSEQSGNGQFRKIANIVDHQNILFEVREDFPMISKNNPLYQNYIEYLSQDERIFSTI